jgi:ATP-binding cassette subfamily B protein
MEPNRRDHPISESKGQTSKARKVVSPQLSLPRHLQETGEHDLSGMTPDGLPILPSEDFIRASSAQQPPSGRGQQLATPQETDGYRREELIPKPPFGRIQLPATPRQTDAFRKEELKPQTPFGPMQMPAVRPPRETPAQNMPPTPFSRAHPPAAPQPPLGFEVVRNSSPAPAGMQPPAPVQQREKLVQVMPAINNTPNPPSLTGKHRWENQTSRYPEELLQLIEAETQVMQAVVAQPTTTKKTKEKKRRYRKKGRVSELRQVTAVECGAACLAMILNYYGYATSISEVQERCGVGRDGLTALEIVKAARLYGFRVRAVSVKQDEFRFVNLPAIVHWEFNHFLVVERWSENWVDVLDPAMGRRKLTLEEFDEGFTGVAVMVEPGAQFEQRAQQKTLTAWAYMRSLVQTRSTLTQIIGASLLLQLIGLGAPLITEVIIDQILPGKDINMLVLMGIGMLILIIMQATTTLLRSSLLIYMQTRIDAHMMINFFEHLLSLPYRFFQLRLNGDLLARVNSNGAIRDLLTNQLISTLLDGGTVIVYFFILLTISKTIAEMSLVIGAIQIALLLFTSPAIRRLTQRNLEAEGKTQGYLNEALSGIATLKAAGAEQRSLEKWENLFFEEMNVSLRLSYLSLVVSTILGIVGALGPLALLWVGAMQVINGTMSVGTMLALNTLAIEFLTPLGSLAGSLQQLQVVRSHFARIADVVGAQPEQDLTRVKTPQRLTGRVELRKVSFQYDQNAPMILQDINIRIAPGQKVALVGRTGSGKSTLGKLLVGLITPTRGDILYDGEPLENLNYQAVRSQFGIVLQEAFIFSGSVKENIALNNPDMDMRQIVEAAQMAAIDEDIEKMPMGYDTLVSEGGSAFSGGQRQRLALARALANRPALLLLDEATSALDVATEQTVERNLSRIPSTQIIIAHRLSTIRNADVILVLDQGRIVEQGSHEQLLRRNGFYARLIQTQLQNGEIAHA